MFEAMFRARRLIMSSSVVSERQIGMVRLIWKLVAVFKRRNFATRPTVSPVGSALGTGAIVDQMKSTPWLPIVSVVFF